MSNTHSLVLTSSRSIDNLHYLANTHSHMTYMSRVWIDHTICSYSDMGCMWVRYYSGRNCLYTVCTYSQRCMTCSLVSKMNSNFGWENIMTGIKMRWLLMYSWERLIWDINCMCCLPIRKGPCILYMSSMRCRSGSIMGSPGIGCWRGNIIVRMCCIGMCCRILYIRWGILNNSTVPCYKAHTRLFIVPSIAWLSVNLLRKTVHFFL